MKQLCSILKSFMNTNTTLHFQALDSIHSELYLVVFFCFAVLSFFYRAEWQLTDMKGPVPMLHLPTFLLPLFLLGLVSRTFLESCVIFLLKHTAAHWGFGLEPLTWKTRLWSCERGDKNMCVFVYVLGREVVFGEEKTKLKLCTTNVLCLNMTSRSVWKMPIEV